MIDEKKLIEEITTFGERMTNNGMQGDFHIKIITAIIDIIANQVKVSEWIPCSERLPEDEKTKLVTLSDGKVEGAFWNERSSKQRDNFCQRCGQKLDWE